MALFDDLTKKASKFTEKTIEKSSELADTAKIKISIKSTQADLDKQFIELGKVYYEMCCKDNIFDKETEEIIKKIINLKEKIEKLEEQLNKC